MKKTLRYILFLQINLIFAQQQNLPSPPPIQNNLLEPSLAQVYSTSTQTPIAIVGALIKAENVQYIKNFEFSQDQTYLTCKSKGVYFCSASVQPAALNLGINGHLGIWFELNHKPIQASSCRLYVTETAPIVFILAPLLIALDVGDTIGTKFASSGPNIGITYIDAPSYNEPSAPSYIFTIYKVAEL